MKIERRRFKVGRGEGYNMPFFHKCAWCNHQFREKDRCVSYGVPGKLKYFHQKCYKKYQKTRAKNRKKSL